MTEMSNENMIDATPTNEPAVTSQETNNNVPSATTNDNEVILENTIEIEHLDINKLQHFKGHPFKLYEGQLLTDMVESIKANGLFYPVIARPLEDSKEGKYEILSGHNRVEASKLVGLDVIPVIVRRGLNDNEAMLIVTETNLIQRKFEDMSHSERAISLASHYNAMKLKSGYRSDLIEEIETITNSPVAKRSSSMTKLGEQHGLSKDTIARYLRVDSLIPKLKERLDDNKVSLRSAVALSHLRHSEQKILDGLLGDADEVSMKVAYVLKEKSKSTDGSLKKSEIDKILKSRISPSMTKSYKLNNDIITKYFVNNQDSEEIDKILSKALELYFSDYYK